eukprot:TRINITY_DN7524_c0_g1_i1.p1 TRINITY_DN7524_c0_g1~~TRINITY_DN7524_c0_g1_i1.p1  ORF type:complete len:103 (-),score=9.46 TRINITY_DN7524_c0_g1_i1:411-719(-)
MVMLCSHKPFFFFLFLFFFSSKYAVQTGEFINSSFPHPRMRHMKHTTTGFMEKVKHPDFFFHFHIVPCVLFDIHIRHSSFYLHLLFFLLFPFPSFLALFARE